MLLNHQPHYKLLAKHRVQLPQRTSPARNSMPETMVWIDLVYPLVN